MQLQTESRGRRRRTPYALLAVAVAVLTAAVLTQATGARAADHDPGGGHSETPIDIAPAPLLVPDPPPKTIVRISGDAADGFGIHYFDGTADFPPTNSEALAECGEYDTQVERVRCRTKVRTWYYGLADQKATIHYYKAVVAAAS